MKFISLVSIFIFSVLFGFGQLTTELKKKQENLTNIRLLLKKIEKKSDKSVKKLNIINSEIEQSKDYLKSISEQISVYEKQIATNEKSIYKLKNINTQIKNEYENLIFFAYKTRNSRNKSTYIFASENFEQAYSRFKYLIFLTDYLKQMSIDYKKSSDSIAVLNSFLSKQKSELINLHSEQKIEFKSLAQSKTNQKKVLKKLNAQKSLLQSEIQREEKNADILRRAVAKEIADEQAKQKEKKNTSDKKSKNQTKNESEKKKSQGKISKNNPDLTNNKKKSDTKILNNFEKNKGKLIYPIEGEISGYYGNHQHAVLKNVTVKNDGIDITATGNLNVHAVYDGTISKIIQIPGANKAVIIRHDNYFSVYSNLVSVSVTENQQVKQNQTIGKVFSEKGNPEKSVINFQIWKQNAKQNPTEWLKK